MSGQLRRWITGSRSDTPRQTHVKTNKLGAHRNTRGGKTGKQRGARGRSPPWQFCVSSIGRGLILLHDCIDKEPNDFWDVGALWPIRFETKLFSSVRICKLFTSRICHDREGRCSDLFGRKRYFLIILWLNVLVYSVCTLVVFLL